MPNFQRSTWTAIFFLALLAPFGIIFMLSLIAQPGKTTGTHPADAGATTLPAHPLLGPPMVLAPGPAPAPIFAAGDAKTLWVAHPIVFDPTGKKLPAFEILARASNSAVWTLVKDSNNVPVFNGFPQGLAAFPRSRAPNSRAILYVFNRAGAVQSFSGTRSALQDNLPPEHLLLAATGSPNGIFAVTAGIPVPGSGKPGDLLDLIHSTGPPPLPAATASQPAVPTSLTVPAPQPAPVALVNAYWLKESHWIILPPPGPIAAAPSDETPTPAALVAIAQQADRLLLFWVEPSTPASLVLRTLDLKSKTPAWSPAARSQLPEPIPANSRLLPVLLDQTPYLFWPRQSSVSSGALELRGGRIASDSPDPLPAKNFLPPLSLKAAGEDLNPATDITLGPAENSIAVIVKTPGDKLATFLFTDHGEFSSGPTTVEPQTPRGESQFAQNVAILLLTLLLTLSFWKWRQRAGVVKLPPGMVIAKPLTRALAFLIDLAIPYLLVCFIFSLWENDGYSAILSTAFHSILDFDILFASPPVMLMLAIYLLHVTIGELFFRRSIGKALTGLQILMIDAKPPTVAAILIRNIVRLPELLLLVGVIYLFVTRNHQRLGDVAAKTLVIAHQPPNEAITPDDE